MKPCYSDSQKLGGKPRPFRADMPRQSSITLLKMHKASAIWIPQLCKGMAAILQWRAAPGAARHPGKRQPPAQWHQSLGIPWERRHFLQPRTTFPGKVLPSETSPLQKDNVTHHCKILSLLAEGPSLHEQWVPKYPPSGTCMGNSEPTYPPFLFSKGYTLNFKCFKKWYPLILASGLWRHWPWGFMGSTTLFYITICSSAFQEWTGYCDWWPCCQIHIFKCWTQRHHLEPIPTLCQKVFLPPGGWQQFCLMPVSRALFLMTCF